MRVCPLVPGYGTALVTQIKARTARRGRNCQKDARMKTTGLHLIGLSLLLVVLVSPSLRSAPALAQGTCPPGSIPGGAMVPGQENAGWTACLPMGSADEEAPAYDEGEPSPPPFSAAEFDALIEWERANARQEEENRLRNDPIYRELKQGVWKYTRVDPNDPRQTCQVSFLQLRGGAILTDWIGDSRGTYLAFFGAGIPPVGDVERARVELTQSGETQTVTAVHAPVRWASGLGMIIFAVPSTQALLDSIEDRQDFTLAMEGRTVLSGEWHNGSKALSWLRDCVRARHPG